MKSWRIYPDENKDLKSKFYLKVVVVSRNVGLNLSFVVLIPVSVSLVLFVVTLCFLIQLFK